MTHPHRSLHGAFYSAVMGAFLIALVSASVADAQTTRRGSPSKRGGSEPREWELPTDSEHWINSPPLSAEALAGKGVVLFFFDEACPVCIESWPELQRRSEPYAERPVIFIGVNSGTNPRELRNYVRQNRIGWPVIADVDRSLESEMGVPWLETPASARVGSDRHGDDDLARLLEKKRERDARQNRMDRSRQPRAPQKPTAHVKYITGEGTLADGDPGDFAGTAEKALQGAAWRVDPAGIPKPLRGAWRAIEIGSYADAASAITKADKAKGGPLKAGADRLLTAVKEELLDEAGAIREALAEDQTWQAYKLLDAMVERYDGYGLTQKAEEKRDELAKSEAVKKELAARKTLDKAIRTGSKGNAGAVRRARGMLERLIEASPGTEAAGKAKEILANL